MMPLWRIPFQFCQQTGLSLVVFSLWQMLLPCDVGLAKMNPVSTTQHLEIMPPDVVLADVCHCKSESPLSLRLAVLLVIIVFPLSVFNCFIPPLTFHYLISCFSGKTLKSNIHKYVRVHFYLLFLCRKHPS